MFEISIKDGVDVFFPIDFCKDFGSCTTKMVVPDIWIGFSPSHLAMGCGALSFAKVCFRGYLCDGSSSSSSNSSSSSSSNANKVL